MSELKYNQIVDKLNTEFASEGRRLVFWFCSSHSGILIISASPSMAVTSDWRRVVVALLSKV